jgi:hypothetical protein
MATDYFVFTKPANRAIHDNTNIQSFCFDEKHVHILPKNNLDYYQTHGLFENALMEWCKQFCNKDSTFLDIGAHSGTYTVSLSDQCKEVYSFEPQKMTYYSLCGSVALSGKENVTCYQFGLGSPEQIGQQTLKIVSNDGGGSSLHSTNGILREETIEVRTLDELNIADIGFIKMDVEENELQVLKGALKTLEKSNYPTILFESNYENHELFDYIKQIGYSGIISVSGCNNMFLTQK